MSSVDNKHSKDSSSTEDEEEANRVQKNQSDSNSCRINTIQNSDKSTTPLTDLLKKWENQVIDKIFLEYSEDFISYYLGEKEIPTHIAPYIKDDQPLINVIKTESGKKRVRAIYYNLESLDQEYFILYLLGYKEHEIANNLNMPKNIVKSRIFYIQQLIRNILEKETM